jgi:hypothetical protein
MTRYPWPRHRPPNDPELRVIVALTLWARRHPDHPGLTGMALHAYTGLGNPALGDALTTLTDDQLIHRIRDPLVPGPDRWALR